MRNLTHLSRICIFSELFMSDPGLDVESLIGNYRPLHVYGEYAFQDLMVQYVFYSRPVKHWSAAQLARSVGRVQRAGDDFWLEKAQPGTIKEFERFWETHANKGDLADLITARVLEITQIRRNRSWVNSQFRRKHVCDDCHGIVRFEDPARFWYHSKCMSCYHKMKTEEFYDSALAMRQWNDKLESMFEI